MIRHHLIVIKFIQLNKGTASVTDDDATPELTIANASGLEGTASNGTVEFTPTLSAISGRNVVITYSTGPSGANPVSANDYNSASDLTIDDPSRITHSD